MRMRTLVTTLLVALTTAILVTASLAAPASATTMRTWSRLAKCESGGHWHINSHNGFYGGLQIAPGTWRSYGGKRFAPLPHGASKRQQVRVAKRIKRGQGWGAWPSCSRRIGARG